MARLTTEPRNWSEFSTASWVWSGNGVGAEGYTNSHGSCRRTWSGTATPTRAPGWAKPKRPTYGLPTQRTPGPGTAGCRDTAGDRPVRIWNADPANSGTRPVAAGYRDTAGNQPVRIRNADPNISGTRLLWRFRRFSLNWWHLHPPKCLSSVGWLVGTSIDKCLTLLFGLCYGRHTTLVSPGGGRIECRPVGARGKMGHTGRTGWGINRTLRIAGSDGGLSSQLEKTARQEGEGPGNTCG